MPLFPPPHHTQRLCSAAVCATRSILQQVGQNKHCDWLRRVLSHTMPMTQKMGILFSVLSEKSLRIHSPISQFIKLISTVKSISSWFQPNIWFATTGICTLSYWELTCQGETDIFSQPVEIMNPNNCYGYIQRNVKKKNRSNEMKCS